jgi:hypothetical protein
MPEDSLRQSIIDDEHLKLLSLGCMISAGTSALFSLFGLFYAIMGIGMGFVFSHTQNVPSKADQPPPAFVGWLLAGIGTAIVLFMVALGASRWRASRCLKRHSSRTFCMVVAAITCLEFPYGTALGVLTFLVLGRESVVRVFNSRVAANSGQPTS